MAGSPDIDLFCSSTDWIVPAHQALTPGRRGLFATDGKRWFAGAVRTVERGARLLEPLEASWALGSPLVGITCPRDAAALVDWMAARSDWDVALVTGLFERSQTLTWAAAALSRRFSVRAVDRTPRYVADLGAGIDAYLGRRSRNFRRSVVRAEARARDAGIVIEAVHATTPGEADAVFDRIVAVEGRSWKGVAGVGIDRGAMGAFYRVMGQRLAKEGRHRCWLARLGERDVGFVLGGVRDDRYRGLQFSFDRELARLSVGNVMQLTQMRQLVDEGIHRYDLGSEAEYKRRWADAVVSSPLLVAYRT